MEQCRKWIYLLAFKILISHLRFWQQNQSESATHERNGGVDEENSVKAQKRFQIREQLDHEKRVEQVECRGDGPGKILMQIIRDFATY